MGCLLRVRPGRALVGYSRPAAQLGRSGPRRRRPAGVGGSAIPERMSTAERRIVRALLTAVTLVAVLLLALVGGPTGGAFLVRSTALAAATDSHLRTLVAALPFGYAFGAGMLAAFNPCGFGLVPAYLGLHLGSGRLRGAVRFA